MKTDQLYTLFKESTGVSTDTRTIKKGEMFFALWGSKFNGNLYATEALEKGASVAVIDDPLFETDKTILVDDCLFELQALATHHRGLVVVFIRLHHAWVQGRRICARRAEGKRVRPL